MPLKDLLWACPLCHAVESLALDGRCRGCGSAFRRGRGARIIAAGPGRQPVEHTAVEWLGTLPWPDLDGEGLSLPAHLQPPFDTEVVLREAGSEHALRRGGAFLGAVERFGAKRAGRLRLDGATLRFVSQSGAGDWVCRLLELTAIQPASSAIQLKARARPVVSVRFPGGSVRLWEQRLKYCTRNAFRHAGEGEISEFQPRIRTR